MSMVQAAWRRAAQAALAALALGTGSAPAAVPGPTSGPDAVLREFYNPQAAPDDVALPMPCGLKMIFRRVYTSLGSRGKMRDRTFQAGRSGIDDLIAQAPHEMQVQGAFRDRRGHYYLISKYEISALQYAAVMEEQCPAPERRSGLPQVDVSWFDAVEFTRRYSLFLAAQQRDPFVRAHDKLYVRLPSEGEWEFASRGGLAVTPAEFQSPLPPMPGGGTLRDYAFHQGAQSSNGKLNFSGQLRPNPLGIHDMLGNVQEMMFEPFRATRTGRLHGQYGGFVVRGGGFLTNPGDLSSALRIEKPFFIKGRELRAKDIGMRLVAAQPVIGDRRELTALNREIETLGRDAATLRSAGQRDQDNLTQLDAILQLGGQSPAPGTDPGAQTAALLRELHDLRHNLIRANAARAEQHDHHIVSALRLGGNLCAFIASAQRRWQEAGSAFEQLVRRCRSVSTQPACAELDALMQRRDGEYELLSYFVSYYADHLVSTAGQFDLAELAAMEQEAGQRIASNSRGARTYRGARSREIGRQLARNVGIFLEHLRGYRPNTDADELRRSISARCAAAP